MDVRACQGTLEGQAGCAAWSPAAWTACARDSDLLARTDSCTGFTPMGQSQSPKNNYYRGLWLCKYRLGQPMDA